MPQLGKILARRFASVYIAQLNGIYLWEIRVCQYGQSIISKVIEKKSIKDNFK